jgi:hypothetical protein
MSQVYPWDRGTNFAVELGRDVAREVLKDAAGRAAHDVDIEQSSTQIS